MKPALFLAALVALASPASAKNADLDRMHYLCMKHFHPQHKAPSFYDPGFEKCPAVEEAWWKAERDDSKLLDSFDATPKQ